MNTIRCIVFLLSLGPSLCSPAVAEPASKIVIIVGPSNHRPGTHEVSAGGRVMQFCLQNAGNVNDIEADIFYQWPPDSALRGVSSVVFIGDTFPPNRLPNSKDNLSKLAELMDRGCGIVCVHYATGLRGEDVQADGEHPLLHWMGGYFATGCEHHKSVAKIYESATINIAAPQHPIWRGCQEFTLRDEPYINNYFGNPGNRLADNVTAIATSMLPPDAPRKETVAWCVQRDDGGRGFAVVMPHFYRNWGIEDLRRMILNGIVWTAHREVPAVGVQSRLPDLATFNPEAVDPQPRVPGTPRR